MLVVNPNNRVTGVNPELPAIEPPLWAGLIASYNDADILDAEALNLNILQTEQKIRDSGHKDILIVVMGNNPSVSSTPKMPISEALADQISDLKVSFTGIHPIAVNYRKYPVITRPFKGFPMMPWDKLPMNLYRAHNWHCLDGSSRSPYASIYTSLGCPFKCYYCNIHTLYGERKVQFRPRNDILREIDWLITRYKVRNIKIWDELFALSEARVLDICHCLKYYDLNIWTYARLDTTTEKMLKAMKLAGINWLAYGFESVTDKKFVNRTEDVIRMTRDAGINIMANFMFGLPGTNRDDDERSLEFAMEHLFEFVNFYDAKPYPGSQWYENASQHPQVKAVEDTFQNKIAEILDWKSFDQYANISPFRQQAFQQYFTNPDYLTMIERKWEIQAVDHIRSMVNWKLVELPVVP